MKMKLMRIALILNVLLLLFSLYTTTINAIPAFKKRQDFTNGIDFQTDLHKPFKPLDVTPGPIVRDHYLNLSRAQLSPDGFERTVWTSNDQYPGPMIRANRGDTILVYVENHLDDDVTIHWHGIFQRGTTYYDGVSGQTQCLIRSGQKFLYNFTVGEQYGTYWWHSHYHYQYIDGLRGPLIIHDPEDPYLSEYDGEEFVMTVSDWYHELAEVLLAKLQKPGYRGFNPIPDAGLISGKGRYDCSKAPEGSICTPNNPYSVYEVEKGKRYRFRIINTSAEVHFRVSIDEHPLRVIEVEGENVDPVEMDHLSIAIGQRYSVIVNCDKDVKNFWIRATIIDECIHGYRDGITINNDSALNYKVLGILRYSGAPTDEDPTTEEFDEPSLGCRDVDHKILELNPRRPFPGPVTQNFTWDIGFRRKNGVRVGTINGRTFVPDLENPTVKKVMYGGEYVGKDLDKDLPEEQNAFVLDTMGGVVEITLINRIDTTHPFHLHGHNFFIMGAGDGDTVQQDKLDLIDPSVRDTISLQGKSWAVIRFEIDNPGVWAFHCHIEWHASLGMIGQIIEVPSELAKMELPPGICP